MSLDQRSPIRPVSKKRAAENRRREKAKAVVWERSGGRCEMASLIANYDPEARKCRGEPEFHEVVTRARGGPIDDPENIILGCSWHHLWVTSNPRAADLLGLTRPSWTR